MANSSCHSTTPTSSRFPARSGPMCMNHARVDGEGVDGERPGRVLLGDAVPGCALQHDRCISISHKLPCEFGLGKPTCCPGIASSTLVSAACGDLTSPPSSARLNPQPRGPRHVDTHPTATRIPQHRPQVGRWRLCPLAASPGMPGAFRSRQEGWEVGEVAARGRSSSAPQPVTGSGSPYSRSGAIPLPGSGYAAPSRQRRGVTLRSDSASSVTNSTGGGQRRRARDRWAVGGAVAGATAPRRPMTWMRVRRS
jgi:hypothetical protein